MKPQPHDINGAQESWRTLRYLNLSRLILAGLLTVLALSGDIPLFGSSYPTVFLYTAIFYLSGSFITGITLSHRRPNFVFYVYLHALLDIGCLTLLMHASGGVDSGLGMLLLGTIAATALLSPGLISYFTAAIASLMVLAEQINIHLTGNISPDYTAAGILGSLLFLTAVLTSFLVHKLRATEELAKQQGVDLANLSQLNEIVIQKLASGVLVIDEQQQIRLHNAAAKQLLGLHNEQTIPAQLAKQLQQWQSEPNFCSTVISTDNNSAETLPHFIQLGLSREGAVLILLEDTREVASRAQQLKLAAMGRLTGSIAHEIRNPLGAISHASQLLAESTELASTDRRFVEIINEQSHRINDIIRNVMELGRRDKVQTETIELHSWLTSFYQEFMETCNADGQQLLFCPTEKNISIRFDPSQLRQIVWNLCENGWRHSSTEKTPRLTLSTHTSAAGQAYLEILDSGGGIPLENQQQVFEPFFTTDTQGTGLGLYIAKALCEGNRARLEYIPDQSGGCFRIYFTAV